MATEDRVKKAEQFIVQEIDSVPHLEALLLIWNSRPVFWNPGQMAQRLFLPAEAAERILDDLVRKNLATLNTESGKTYAFASSADNDQLLIAVDSTYRKELIRLSRIIHSKGSPAARDFARAFRLKKD